MCKEVDTDNAQTREKEAPEIKLDFPEPVDEEKSDSSESKGENLVAPVQQTDLIKDNAGAAFAKSKGLDILDLDD